MRIRQDRFHLLCLREEQTPCGTAQGLLAPVEPFGTYVAFLRGILWNPNLQAAAL